MSNRKHCQDYTKEASRINRREHMQRVHDEWIQEKYKDNMQQILLCAPLVIFILIGYIAIWFGWIPE